MKIIFYFTLCNISVKILKCLALGLALDGKFHNFYYLTYYFIDIFNNKIKIIYNHSLKFAQQSQA